MSQHDYNIANGGGAAVRADINNALAAILSLNSGATAPTTTKPFMLWYDTANSVIKQRNAADNAWVTGFQVDASGNASIGASSAADSAARLTVSGTSAVLLDSSGSILRFNKIAGTDTGWISNRSYSWHNGSGLAISTQTADPLRFGTNGAERVNIDASGQAIFGPGVANGASGINTASFANDGSLSPVLTFNNNYGGGSKSSVQFKRNNTTVGSIAENGSSTAYNTSSDYRLKENIAPITGALEAISKLKPVTYTWKNTGINDSGFIAHELQEVCPSAVTGEKDAMKTEQYVVEPEKQLTVTRQRQKVQTVQERVPVSVWVGGSLVQAEQEITREVPVFEIADGIAVPVMEDYEAVETIPAVLGEREVPDYQGIDTSFLAGLFTAAIQEQQTIINQLRADVDALKST